MIQHKKQKPRSKASLLRGKQFILIICSSIFLVGFILVWQNRGVKQVEAQASFVCQEGPEITSNCLCGGITINRGYCCRNIHFEKSYGSCPSGNFYYVDDSASNDLGNGSVSSPKRYISSGLALMSGGDTLIIKDGVYQNALDIIGPQSIPNGSSGNYTTIRAEHIGQAEVNGQDIRQPIHIKGQSYIQVDGFYLHNCSGALLIQESNHIKVFRTGTECGFQLDDDFQYILAEDVWAWGDNRYKFLSYGGHDSTVSNLNHYVIFRRSVCRYDYGPTDGPHACFSSYTTGHNYYQNSIAIDNIQAPTGHNATGFNSPGTGSRHNIHYNGCIALNLVGSGFRVTPNTGASNYSYKNNIAYDVVEGWYVRNIRQSWEISNSLIGRIRHKGEDTTTCLAGPDPSECEWSGNIPSGVSFRDQQIAPIFRNSIFTGVAGDVSDEAAIRCDAGVCTDSNYNLFYNNNYNLFSYGGQSIGTNSLTNVNPIYNASTNSSGGLKYLVRVESNSNLSGRGENGADIGPDITKKIGVSGTLYGEPGWSEVTDEDLWPWPYEDIFTPLMRSYSEHGVNGNRGFTAYQSPFGSPNTLTSYIWEYLGNQIPADIYGSAPQPQTCSQLGGVCYSNPCSSYQSCASQTGTCASGYCCQGVCTTPPVLLPDIVLTKGADRTEAAAGEELTYTITYTNQGAGSAQNITIIDSIPDGTTYVAGSASNGGVFNPSVGVAGSLTWTIAGLPAGGSGSVSFRVIVE